MADSDPTPTIKRRNHGRNHSYEVNGEKWPGRGVTTLLNEGYPKPAIPKWAARACSQEVLDYWDELVEMLPSERAERIRTAPDRDRDAAARRGTEVHRYASKLIAHEDVAVPDELVGHVDAYIKFLDEWEVRPLLVEAPLVNMRYRYCGTLDTVSDLVDRKRWLLDLKTTRSGVFLESALQLSGYRNAEWVLDSDGRVQAMPEVDRCGVVWLKADRTYEFVPVDAGPATFEVFLCVLRIAGFAQSDEALGVPLQPFREVLF